MGRTRRKLSSEEKLKMVMAVIQDGKAVSDVAQENNVHPNMILNWKKEFLENAAMIFDRHRPDITEKAQRRKIEELETKLKKKDEVIAEIELVHTGRKNGCCKICPCPQELPVRLPLPCLADG